jgi:hypothetical protein
MSEKKRKNDEIIIFLEQFKKWISQKLSSIQIIKLSSDHIKETELEIKRIKSEIKKVQLLIKSQQAVVKKLVSSNNKVKSASLIPNISKPTSISIDSDIEIYEPDEVDEDDELL